MCIRDRPHPTKEREEFIQQGVERLIRLLEDVYKRQVQRAPFGRGDMILRTEFGTLAGATEPRADGCVATW